MNIERVRGVLFAKNFERVMAFYVGALGMTRAGGDDDHAVLRHDGFELVVHRIPANVAATIVIADPPVRRAWAALRLDYPVASVEDTRKLARSLGGDVDEQPPPWAGSVDFFLGYDPEGNQFGLGGRPKP